MTRLLDTLLRPRRAIAVALLGLVLAALLISLGQAPRTPSTTDNLPAGYDSTRVVELQRQLPSAEDQVAVVLWTTADGSADIAADQDDLGATLAALTGGGMPVQVSEDGTAALGVVPVPGTSATDVAAGVGDLRDTLRDEAPEGVTVQVTGPAAVQADLAAVFEGADFRLLGATAVVVALLLLITYRSPVLWLVPLVVVGLADQVAAVLATRTMSVFGVPWDESTVGILSVLVFGAGTDYALLLISRYRDELSARRAGTSPCGHARAAYRRGGAVQRHHGRRRGADPRCCASSRRPGGSGSPARSASSWRRSWCSACCPSRWCSSAAGSSGRGSRGWGDASLAESRTVWRRVGAWSRRRPAALRDGDGDRCSGPWVSASPRSHRSLQSDQFLDDPGGDRRRRPARGVLPRRGLDPDVVVTRGDADRCARRQRRSGGRLDAAPAVGRRLTQVEVVLDGDPGSAQARAGAGRCATRSTATPRRTSAAPRRRPWTSRPRLPATGG